MMLRVDFNSSTLNRTYKAQDTTQTKLSPLPITITELQ